MLLLSWLAPGGGRGIVALDLLNCTSVQSTPSPTPLSFLRRLHLPPLRMGLQNSARAAALVPMSRSPIRRRRFRERGKFVEGSLALPEHIPRDTRRTHLAQSRRGKVRITRATKVERPVERSPLAVCIVR